MFALEYLMAFLAPHDCLLCSRESDLLCSTCLNTIQLSSPQLPQLAGIRQLWVAAGHEGVIRQLLHRYKFERAASIAPLLANLLDRAAPPLPNHTLVTYVPTATSRIRQRGYDHAHDLAKAFATSRHLPFAPLLTRHGQAHQVGASKRQRQQQVANAYQSHHPTLIKNAHILLIDDVVTTGSTLQAAAKVLLQTGADLVDALAVAYKQ